MMNEKLKQLANTLLDGNSVDYRGLAMTNEEFVANLLPNVYQPTDQSSRGPNAVGWDLEDHEDDVNIGFLESKLITPATDNAEHANHCDRWKADAFTFTYVDRPNQKINVYYTKNNRTATRHFVKQDNVMFNKNLVINGKSTKQNINTQVLLDCDVTTVDAEGKVTTDS